MKTNYLQNISIALNQFFFTKGLNAAFWKWKEELAVFLGIFLRWHIYFFCCCCSLLFVRSYKKIITGSSFKDLWPMDSSRFHCFIGRGPFGCIFLGRTKINFFLFTCQVQGHSSSLCPQCLPDCELTTYTYTTSSVPFRFLPQKIILTTFGRFDHM